MSESLSLIDDGQTKSGPAIPIEFTDTKMEVEEELDGPVIITPLMHARLILWDAIISSREREEPLVIEPREVRGIYATPNGTLIKHYVNLAEVYAARGIKTQPYEPVSPL